MPSAGIERTFTGATRDEAQDAVTDYFKGSGGSDVTKVLQAAVRETAIDPVAGNPDSLMSLMGEADFAQGTDFLRHADGTGVPEPCGLQRLGWRVKRESRGIIAPCRCWASVSARAAG